jgi:PAS domain S-box-containing protein
MATALDRKGWDIVISDYNMPHFSGIAALALLQNNDLDLPFIIVSGVIGEDTAVATMKAGAHDYIMKGNLRRLVPAVQRELREAAERARRRQAEQDLQDREAYLQAVMNNVSDGIITVSREGVIESINLAAQILFGYVEGEVFGLHFTALLAPPYSEQYEAYLNEYLTTGRSRVVGFGPREVIGQHKDGSTFPIDMSINEMRLQDRQSFLCSLRGATRRQPRQQDESRPTQESGG